MFGTTRGLYFGVRKSLATAFVAFRPGFLAILEPLAVVGSSSFCHEHGNRAFSCCVVLEPATRPRMFTFEVSSTLERIDKPHGVPVATTRTTLEARPEPLYQAFFQNPERRR